MVQEKQNQKKVHYSIMSGEICKVCHRPLKQNSASKGHTLCYVCFKISKGKTVMTKSKYTTDGYLISVKNIDLKELQRFNIKKYKTK